MLNNGTVDRRSDGWGFIWPQVGSFRWPRSPATVLVSQAPVVKAESR
jgi:hypothetical protein